MKNEKDLEFNEEMLNEEIQITEEDIKDVKITVDMVELINIYYKKGNQYVLDRIIKEFEPLMYKLAKPYFLSSSVTSGRLDINDFIQEARLEIFYALKNKTYDIKKSKPITFFYTIIKNRFYSLNLENSSSFKFTNAAKEKTDNYKKYTDFINNGMTQKTALKKAKLTKKDLTNWAPKVCVDIDTPIKGKDIDNDLTYADVVPDTNQETPEEKILKEKFYELIKSNLSDIEYKVLMANNVDNLSLREISEQLNIKEHKVRNILKLAIKKLQDCEALKDYRNVFRG